MGQLFVANRLKSDAAIPRQQAALAALALQLQEQIKIGSGTENAPNRLNSMQVVGLYGGPGMGSGPVLSIAERSGKLYLLTPGNPDARLVSMGGDRYRMEGYPNDFIVAFTVTEQ
jgi:hypothetical protein